MTGFKNKSEDGDCVFIVVGVTHVRELVQFKLTLPQLIARIFATRAKLAVL